MIATAYDEFKLKIQTLIWYWCGTYSYIYDSLVAFCLFVVNKKGCQRMTYRKVNEITVHVVAMYNKL